MFNRLAIAAATFGLVMIVSGCASPSAQDTLAGLNANRNAEVQGGRHRAQPASSSYGDLLYVAPADPGQLVAYYTYPAGELVGTLNATARGLCSDTKGNVFLINDGYIQEFAHGGTSPINEFGNGNYIYQSCSVDPASGNLAVTFDVGGSAPGIAIFKNATGNQTTYTDSDFEHFYYCGYDGSGNLLADGFKPSSGNPSAFAELPAGSSEFETIALNHFIEKAGQVQWDGEYMTIADEEARKIYRVEISGSVATVVGGTPIKHSGGGFGGPWIYRGTVIVPVRRNGKKQGAKNIGFWNYPQGGSPTKVFQDPSYGPMAVTISPGR